MGLLCLIAVACTGLSFLQYRWSGEVSRAEGTRLRSGLNQQVLRLTRAFDDEISEACKALLPNAKEIRDEGFQGAHSSRYQDWASSHERGLFARIGIAAKEQGSLNLYGFDGQGRIIPMEWPANWEILRAAMTARAHAGGPPPSAPLDSTLIEVPVFDQAGDRRGTREELEWMIFELSEDHLRGEMLPRLVSEYLNSGSEGIYDASVSWADPGRPVVFSTRSDK